MLVRGATTLDHQVKKILKNQSADPKIFSHHFSLATLKYGMVLILTYRYLHLLTHSFPMHSFSTPWKHRKTARFCDVFRGVEEGCIGNKWVRIKSNSIFSVHNVYDIKFISRLRLNFSVNEHRVCHDFADGTYCMCDSGSATETTLRFLLQCKYYQTIRLELLSSIYNLDSKIKTSSSDKLLHLNYYTDQNDIVSK